MSSGGLVRGGRGELPLREVLLPYPHLACAMRRDTEPIAREYEAAHPGVVVVCDWEIIDDEDIAAMSGTAKQQALRDRGALAARREAATKVEQAPDPIRAGDPGRAAEVLRRARIDMRLLDVTHPEYVRLFTDFATQINGLEAAVGEAMTKFELAQKFKDKVPFVSEERKQELATKVEAYKALALNLRKRSIEAAVDPELTRMLLEHESDLGVREMIVKKLFTMGAVAA